MIPSKWVSSVKSISIISSSYHIYVSHKLIATQISRDGHNNRSTHQVRYLQEIQQYFSRTHQSNGKSLWDSSSVVVTRSQKGVYKTVQCFVDDLGEDGVTFGKRALSNDGSPADPSDEYPFSSVIQSIIG